MGTVFFVTGQFFKIIVTDYTRLEKQNLRFENITENYLKSGN